MTRYIGLVDVAGWGSDRHAREVRGRETLRAVRALWARGERDILADTSRGLRRLIVRGTHVYTRLPETAETLAGAR